jgi:hypothetical protein
MASMRIRKKSADKNFSEKEIDEIVIAQADHDSEWEQPIIVEKTKPTNISIPSGLAARATFIAKLHREKTLEKWLTRIIQERIDIEESAFAEVKREMKTA